ncbi:isoprenylcysteine carboxylmethyltransferase family protein [Teredinibacter sp. KSP-S5-2]|uniref:methyltransferase family protein n=1 Tax=Teredinibacter sp. KSP-S5-2 TaxID=3034506 RepID=UPI002934FD1B|nr:isoprenylcysteine carboxylmethyltransferase family protein [Teredinibacter sp. KSP-S5-2]WNO11364.1 isoprenylcysteine carboxylmethyltransferase family protein [Teredinibacter sp. KSP-S5-2]
MLSIKYKVPPVLSFALCLFAQIVIVRPQSDFSIEFSFRDIFAFVLLVSSLGLVFYSARLFKRNKTTVNPMLPENASQLVVTGVYAYSRNPMYLAMLLVLGAFSVWSGNWFSAALLPVFVGWMNFSQIPYEEQALEKKFGEEYVNYKKRVRRWI